MIGKRAARLSLLACLLSFAGSAAAQSIALSVDPIASLPLGESADFFSFGGGAELAAKWAPPSLAGLGLGPTLSYRYLPTRVGTALSSAALSGRLSWRLEPAKGLGLELRADGGCAVGSYQGESGLNACLGGGLEADLAAGPAFRIGLTGAWTGLLGAEKILYSGLQAGIVLRYLPGAGSKPKLRLDEPAFSPIFPSIASIYAAKPFGAIAVTNSEATAVKNVVLSFYVPGLMPSPSICAEIKSLRRGETIELPIKAVFGESILARTEAADEAAIIAVAYERMGNRVSVERTGSLRVLDRNALSWKDDEVAASFITTKDPAILALSKAVAGSVREDRRAGVPLEFRIALGMAQALKAVGLKYVVDPKSAYSELSSDKSAVDFVQFPAQTLNFRAGDCDDLTVLYCALLESVGISTAFVLVPGHIFAAVELPIGPRDIERIFPDSDRLILSQGRVFVPIECTILGDGFIAAWNEGIKQWAKAGSQGRLVRVEDAWERYPGAPMAASGESPKLPSDKAIAAAYGTEMDRFVDLQLRPQLAALQAEIKKKGTLAPLQNRLGALLGRYGRYEEAERELQKALKSSAYSPAYVNLANIALLKKDRKKALDFFDQARRSDPRNAAAIAGAAACRYDSGDATEAKRLYALLEAQDPALASRYSYIIGAQGASRAAAADAAGVLTWDD